MANKKARVLVGIRVGDRQLKPNDVIDASDKLIKELGADVDTSKPAVDYCINDLNVEVITVAE